MSLKPAPANGRRRGGHRAGPNRAPAGANRHIGHCWFTGKKQYASKPIAKTVKRMTGWPGAVYRCQACGKHEIGGTYGMSRDEHRRIAEYKLAKISGPGAASPEGHPHGSS